MQSVIDSSGHWLSHSECRRMGDALIALEGQCGQITHALSTNSRDWQPISSALGYEFVPIQYPV
jgi:hypothetical protein